MSRAKLLLLTLALIGLAAGGITLGITLAPSQAKDTVKQPTVAPQPYIPPPPPSVQELFELTNAERAKAGVPLLALDENLNKSALDKCNDMVARDYWSHNAPDGTEPWVFVKRYMPKYVKTGENLRYGSTTSETSKTIVGAWLNSTTHRANLLDPVFTIQGFGLCTSNNFVGDGLSLIAVQHLSKP